MGEKLKDFYIDLPSDSSLNYFPDNTHSSFITHLPFSLNLPGRWKVGIAEIKYESILAEKERFSIFYSVLGVGNEVLTLNHHFEYKSSNPLKVLEEFNEAIAKLIWKHNLIEHAKFHVDKRGFCTLTIPSHHKLIFSKNFYKYLNFPETLSTPFGYELDQSSIISSKPIVHQQDKNTQSVYIYADIIGFNIVGDNSAPLLRHIFLPRDKGNITFESIFYKSVVKNDFQTIEINIRDRFGDLVSFTGEPLTLTLHFKRDDD